MAEDDQARARHGGLDVEITVEELPARVKRASEPSGPVQTDAAAPQGSTEEDHDESSGGDGDAQGANRLTALIGKLRDKARRGGDEPASEADEATPDPDTSEPGGTDGRSAARASGFTILSYRSGDGQDGDPPIPGRQTIIPPQEEAAEVEEPEPVDEASETAEIEQPDPGRTEAPPIPADDIEASQPDDQVAIEMEEPAAEIVEPDQTLDEEPLEAHDEPEEPEQDEETQESPGFLAGLRDRFSSDDEPVEEALEAQGEPEPEEAGDSPGLFTRLRSKLPGSKADAIEVPIAMPAPPPTPPLATAEVEVTEESDQTEEAEDSPGLFARLTGKASRDEKPEPEQDPGPEPATAEAPAKTGGFFSRLKEKVTRSGSRIEDPAAAEIDQPPTPPTGDRQPELLADLGQASEPRASDLESLEATIEAVEAADTSGETEEVEDSPGLFARLTGKASGDEGPGKDPEPGPTTAEEPETVAEDTDDDPAKTGGIFSRLKDKVTGSDEPPEEKPDVAEAPEPEAPAPSAPIEHLHEEAVEGGPRVPPTGDRHPELIAAMSTENQTVEEREEPETVAADTDEKPAEEGGLLSRLKDKVAGSDEPPEEEPDVAEAPEPEALEAEKPPSGEADEPTEPDQAPEKKGGLFSRLKDKVAGSDEPSEEEPEIDQAPDPGPEQVPEPPAVEADEPETVDPEEPETSKPSEPEPAVAEAPEPEAGEEPPETPQPATVEADQDEPTAVAAAIDEVSDESSAAEEDGKLPYEEIVRRVEILLQRRREDPEESAAREKVRILAGGSKR